MAFDWLKKMFGGESEEVDPLWISMEKMDPFCSYERFLKLNLSAQQRPVVKGLIDGTIKPSTIEAVQVWAEANRESPDGIDALVFALQKALGTSRTTYLFDVYSQFPAARIPRFENESELTVLFNDAASHLQIMSVEEFVRENQIDRYVLEELDFSELEERITGRPARPPEEKLDKLSVTIHRRAAEDESLYDPVELSEVVDLLREQGYSVSADELEFDEPLNKTGLYDTVVELEPGKMVKLFVWVMPLVEPES